MSPKVISGRKLNLKKLDYDNLEEWLKDSNHVYIGRNMSFYVKGANKSKWHNPFSTKKYGLDKSLELFEDYLLNNKTLLKDIKELKGKDLCCWCKNEGHEPCHGDLLLKLANKE